MMMCQEDGGILEDLVVCRLDAYEYLVVSNTTHVDLLISELTGRGDGYTARVDDRTGDYAVIGVEGPRAIDILSGLTHVGLESLRHYATAETTLAGRNGVLTRTGYTGEDSFEFYCAPDDAPAVWYAIAEVGEAHGIRPAGLACRDVLRLEAGITLCGRELTPEVTPYDAGLGNVVKLDKERFVGKAALTARAASGSTITLAGLIGAGHRSPRAGHAVVDRSDGHQIGTVTSGAPSPTLGCPIAMAYIDIDALTGAGSLAVDVRGRLEPVAISSMPFYSR
jgi:aminomethyltransferase